MSLTAVEKRRALNYAVNMAQFMFIPSEHLCTLIINDHPLTQNLNEQLRMHILEKQHLRLATSMVVKYCKDKLDAKNTWLLDQGDIKVVPKQFKLEENKRENKGEN